MPEQRRPAREVECRKRLSDNVMMNPADTVVLQFDSKLNAPGKGKELTDGLSAAVQIGDTLWFANDETLTLERLSLTDKGSTGSYHGRDHAQFPLDDFLRLPVPPSADPEALEEADVEGLAYEDGYLWLVGSHSLKRKLPKKEDTGKKTRERLAKVSGDGNRYLLARIPVVKKEGTFVLAKSHRREARQWTAAQLAGNDQSDELTKALREDEHLGPFMAIPGKDNGFDIEGLDIVGRRLFIGLRGPVLRGLAVILEVEPGEDEHDPSILELMRIGSDDRPYRKHFLQLEGLGIRDLCISDSDMLILAGPTMDLDGPVAIFRWPGGAMPEDETVVPAEKLERVCDVPFGRGCDHAEGMTLFSPEAGKAHSVLVVYDAAGENRRPKKTATIADVFSL